MPTLARDDLDIYYEVHGGGPRLLLCNGSGQSIENSALLIGLLATSHQVVVHDQRGLGRTGIGRSTGPFTMAQYAADASAVLDDVGWPSAAVLGVSFGGMVAQEFAVTWPTRVNRLALVCTSPGGAGGSSYPLHHLAGLEPVERERVSLSITDSRFDERWLAEHPRDAAMVAELRRRIGESRSGERVEGERRQLEARAHHDVWNRLGAISCPTLVMAGRYDETAPPDNSAAIASRIPGSELRVYEGGHPFLLQDRQAAKDLMAFLGAR